MIAVSAVNKRLSEVTPAIDVGGLSPYMGGWGPVNKEGGISVWAFVYAVPQSRRQRANIKIDVRMNSSHGLTIVLQPSNILVNLYI